MKYFAFLHIKTLKVVEEGEERKREKDNGRVLTSDSKEDQF